MTERAGDSAPGDRPPGDAAAGDAAPPPLPREWLPEPTALEGTPEWRAMAARVVAAAEPKIRALTTRAPGAQVTWPAVLGAWWKPAVAVAWAAAALLLVLSPEPARQGPDPGALPLSLLAAEGEPAGLLEGLGIEADPVLALIALLEQAR